MKYIAIKIFLNIQSDSITGRVARMNGLRKVLVLISRGRARIIRRLIQFLKVDDQNIENLLDGDFISGESFEKRQKYSNSTHLVFWNSRSETIEQMNFPERHICAIKNILLDSLTGMTFTQSKKMIAESSSWPTDHLLLNSVPKPLYPQKLAFSPEVTVLCLPSNGFYHWLCEDLPAYLFALENSRTPITLIQNDAPRFVESFLTFIPGEILRVPRFISTNSFTFTTKGATTGWMDPADLSMLRTFFAKHIQTPTLGKKIYISRLESSRSPKFEKELISMLISDGWLVLTMEEMSLQEQIETISTAQVLCGVHGAGLSGIAWMASGTKLIELSPKRFIPCFARMCNNTGMNYFRIGYEELGADCRELMHQIQTFAHSTN